MTDAEVIEQLSQRGKGSWEEVVSAMVELFEEEPGGFTIQELFSRMDNDLSRSNVSSLLKGAFRDLGLVEERDPLEKSSASYFGPTELAIRLSQCDFHIVSALDDAPEDIRKLCSELVDKDKLVLRAVYSLEFGGLSKQGYTYKEIKTASGYTNLSVNYYTNKTLIPKRLMEVVEDTCVEDDTTNNAKVRRVKLTLFGHKVACYLPPL